MESVLNTIQLFWAQLIVGSLIGVFLSLLGVILILRNMTFFGITLSQVATAGVAISLFLGIKGELPSLLFSVLIFIPFFFLSRNGMQRSDTVLGILFVSFGALSQILISFGGNVQNHLLSAYFGDILTSEVKFRSYSFVLLLICFCTFILFYKRILFLSFDKDEYRVRRLGDWIELVLLLIMTITVSISVNLLGSFYSAALLIVPAFTGLYIFRSMLGCFAFVTIFSFLGTVGGFFLSLVEIQLEKELVYLPTSSTIVCLLTVSSIFLWLGKKFFSGNWFF
jgi:ABC-type Mn2+/Zn2+ transport system permease subunit